MITGVSAVTLFCDSMREEVGGTTSIIGVFPDNVAIEAFPANFPRLAIYTRITVTRDSVPKRIEMALRMPDGTEQGSIVIEGAPLEGLFIDHVGDPSPIGSVFSVIVAAPFLIATPGRILSVVKIGDQELMAGTMFLSQGASPVAQK
jgi:hypothetical protein